MKRGEPRDLQYTSRHGQMTAAHSIRDLFDAVVELVTNADDSYHGQFVVKAIPQDGGTILIEFEPHRGTASSVLRVKDKAAGFRNLARKIEMVGEKTSHAGDRGFMARGLKDCAAVGHVTVETIVDEKLDKAEITPSFQVVPYTPTHGRGERVSSDDRTRLGITRGNGTLVELKLAPRISDPRLETLRRDLPWHFALRDVIRLGGPSRVHLRYGENEPELLHRAEPESDLVYDEEDDVPGYPGVRFRFALWRAKQPLSDPPDRRFRRTGIAIRGDRAFYGCSFLTPELERDPEAPRFFGRLECSGIDRMAEQWDERQSRGGQHTSDNPTFILDPSRRDALTDDHPFVRALFDIPIRVLKQQLDNERRKHESQRKDIQSRETTERLRRLAREASRFMRDKLEDVASTHIVGGTGEVADDVAVKIVPAFTQMRLGTSKDFVVKIDRHLVDVAVGTTPKVGLVAEASSALRLVSEPSSLMEDQTNPGVLRGTFTLEGCSHASNLVVRCQVGDLEVATARVDVLPAEPIDLEIPNGFSFHRKHYTVRQGGRRSLVLRGRLDPASAAPLLRVADSSVAVLRESTLFDHVPGTSYYEANFIIEGRKPNGSTKVTAEADGRIAQCDLSVVDREDEGPELEFKLVDRDLGANYRAAWDRQSPNRLLITTQHESIRRYLGQTSDYPGQHGEAFRVLLAELISDNVCRRIVEEYARAQPQEFDSDKVYLLHNRLMKEFTPIAHRIQVQSPSPNEPSPRS